MKKFRRREQKRNQKVMGTEFSKRIRDVSEFHYWVLACLSSQTLWLKSTSLGPVRLEELEFLA